MSSSCAGSEIPIPEAHELVGGHAFVRPGECIFTFCEAERLRPV